MTTTQDTPQPLKYAVLVSSVRQQRLGHLIANWAAAHASKTHQADLIDLAAVKLL